MEANRGTAVSKTNNWTLFPVFGYTIGKSTYGTMEMDPKAKVEDKNNNNNSGGRMVPRRGLVIKELLFKWPGMQSDPNTPFNALIVPAKATIPKQWKKMGISWGMTLGNCLEMLKKSPQNFICRFYNGKNYDFGFHPSPHVIVESILQHEEDLHYRIKVQFKPTGTATMESLSIEYDANKDTQEIWSNIFANKHQTLVDHDEKTLNIVVCDTLDSTSSVQLFLDKIASFKK